MSKVIRSLVFVPVLAAATLLAGQAPAEEKPPAEKAGIDAVRWTAGEVVDPVPCADAPGHSYAAYLPPNYSSDRAWPVILAFDPAGNGRRAIEVFLPAARRYGYVVIGSNNCRNGASEELVEALNALLRDVPKRIPMHRHRVYAAGMSGGARVACSLGQGSGIAGVIAFSAAFSAGSMPSQVKPVFFGAAGLDDFNYQELRETDVSLSVRHTPHRVVFYDGGHGWPPPEVAFEAVEWIHLQAMRSEVIPRDAAWIESLWQKHLAAAKAETEIGRVCAAYESLVADFRGMRSVAEAEAKVGSFKGSKELRRWEKSEQKAANQEKGWRDRLQEIAAEELSTGEASHRRLEREMQMRAAMESRERRSTFGDPVAGADRTELGSLGTMNSELPDAGQRAVFADFVRELEGWGKTNHAARRVLSGAFVSLIEQGRQALDDREYATAAREFSQALTIHPEPAYLHFDLAVAYALSGERKKAKESLDSAIERGFAQEERIQWLRSALSGSGEDLVRLAPVLVRDRAMVWTSFGLAFNVSAHRKTNRVERLVVRKVAADSEAAQKGIQPGTEIVSADGRDIRSFVARFNPDSDLGRLFVHRRNGDSIALEVRDPRALETRKLTLTQGQLGLDPFPWRRNQDP
ncbi:hypothetical protein DB347_17080 [Opitutaceae bacterium EW11]|nr:hypothetical protein DB347_17080 [Opitutaceae bacterium EW11]